MLLINNKEVEQLLDMRSCLDALEIGYDDLLRGDAVYRPRLDVWVPCERPDGYYRWGTMEGASRQLGVFAVRMKSDIVHWPDGITEEEYCIRPGTFCGLVLLFSVRNGEPLAIINDGIAAHARRRLRRIRGQIFVPLRCFGSRDFRLRGYGAQLS